MKWYRFEKLVGHLRDEARPGRPGYPALVLLRAVLLASLYGLSERELEEALDDRLSFRRFVGLSLEEGTPDHTVLNRFRNRLIAEGLMEKLFGELDRQLEKAGVILKRGTMLDATLIEASVDRHRRAISPRRIPTPASPGAQGKAGLTFGYKAHVGVDEGSGLIRSVITTPANVNDTTPADDLIRGDEAAVWADAAYHTHAREAAEGRGHEGPPDAAAQQASSGAAGQAQTLQPPHRPAQSRRGDHLRHPRMNRMRLTRIRYVGLTKASARSCSPPSPST